MKKNETIAIISPHHLTLPPTAHTMVQLPKIYREILMDLKDNMILRWVEDFMENNLIGGDRVVLDRAMPPYYYILLRDKSKRMRLKVSSIDTRKDIELETKELTLKTQVIERLELTKTLYKPNL
jgi:hypothetical protein